MKDAHHETGTLETMTDADRTKIAYLRDTLAKDFDQFPDLATDWSLLRFLRARNFDREKAVKMLTDCFEFRRKNDYQEALNLPYDAFDLIHKYYASGFCHHDFEGRPVVVEEVAKSHPEKILGHIPDKMVVNFVVQKHERMLHVIFPVMSRIMGKRVDKVVLVADLKDAGISKLLSSKVQGYLSLIAAVGQNYYPDILHKSYILNAPFIFKGLWSIVKGLLDEKTVAKFCIESGNGLKRLREMMNIDFLPAHMGGKYHGKVDLFNGPWRTELQEAWDARSAYPKHTADEQKYFLLGQPVPRSHPQHPPHPKDLTPATDGEAEESPIIKATDISETKHKKISAHHSHSSVMITETPPDLTKDRSNRYHAMTRTPAPKSHTDVAVSDHLRHAQTRTANKNKTMIGQFGYKMVCFNRPVTSAFVSGAPTTSTSNPHI